VNQLLNVYVPVKIMIFDKWLFITEVERGTTPSKKSLLLASYLLFLLHTLYTMYVIKNNYLLGVSIIEYFSYI
jgi:hypothetical protein